MNTSKENDPKWLKAMLLRKLCGCLTLDCSAHGGFDPADVDLVKLLELEDIETNVLKHHQYNRRVALAGDDGDMSQQKPIRDLGIKWP